jgi:hypothetical protein
MPSDYYEGCTPRDVKFIGLSSPEVYVDDLPAQSLLI